MPDHRLERARHPQPEVPPCVRLGHAWSWHHDIADHVCIRCGIVGNNPGYWNTLPERRAAFSAIAQTIAELDVHGGEQ